MVDSTATFSGKIYCNEDEFDISTTISTVGTIPDVNQMRLKETILVNEPTTLTLPYSGQGNGSGDFTIELEGPLSRVATSNPILEVQEGDGEIVLQIEPQGLLQENMYVLGTIHIESFNGEKWDIEVELKATDGEGFQIIRQSGIRLHHLLHCIRCMVRNLSFSKKRSSGNEHNEYVVDNHEFLPGDHL